MEDAKSESPFAKCPFVVATISLTEYPKPDGVR